MIARKKGGGPKTSAGKAIASKNATKHSLRSEQPATPQEQQNIAQYATQLITHYQTNDPLEILQLERIALYREKLARVYQAELAAAQLAQNALEGNPQKIVQEMDNLDDVARGRLLEFLESGQWKFPCGLEAAQLNVIYQEIESLDVAIESEADFEKYLPKLANFLQHYVSYSVSDSDLLSKKLQAVAKRLQEMVDRGIEYRVKINDLVDLIMQLRNENKRREDEIKESEPPSGLDLYIAKRQAELKARMKVKSKPLVDPEQTTEPRLVFPDANEIKKQLLLFTKLHKSMTDAIQGLAQFESTKYLQLQTLSLPNSQSDVLLRYQTAWERRLSAAIGEFLELRKRNHSASGK